MSQGKKELPPKTRTRGAGTDPLGGMRDTESASYPWRKYVRATRDTYAVWLRRSKWTRPEAAFLLCGFHPDPFGAHADDANDADFEALHKISQREGALAAVDRAKRGTPVFWIELAQTNGLPLTDDLINTAAKFVPSIVQPSTAPGSDARAARLELNRQREGTYLAIIAAVIELLIETAKSGKQRSPYESQDGISTEIEARYADQHRGLKKRNVDEIFADAKKKLTRAEP